jgi:hypothetical protein
MLLWLFLGLWSWNWLGSTWVVAMRPESDRVIDFYQDWGSARNYWSGRPIYTPHSISIPQYLRLASNPTPSIEYNIHPPTSVLLVLPLGRLKYSDAVLVWNIISLATLLATLVIVVMVLPVPRSLLLPGVALLPFCLPVLGNLQMGQLTMVLCFLLTVMWALERSGRSSMAGLLLGAATAVKLFPIYLALYYATQRQGRPLLALLVSLLILTSVTVIVLGLDSYRDYLGVVLPWNSEFRIFGYNLSIAGFWHKLFHPLNEGEKIIPLWHSLALARWGTVLSNLVITAIVVNSTAHARTQSQRDLAFALIMTAMLLISPVTWDTSLLLLLVPVTIIACSMGTIQPRWIPVALILILPVVWLPQPLLTTLLMAGRTIEVVPPSFLLGAASLKFYALLGTFALALTALHVNRANTQYDTAEGAAVA